MRHSRVAPTTDVYQQVIPEGVAQMANSIHGELRKPSTATAKTGVITANRRAKRRRVPVRKTAKLTPIDTKAKAYSTGV